MYSVATKHIEINERTKIGHMDDRRQLTAES